MFAETVDLERLDPGLLFPTLLRHEGSADTPRSSIDYHRQAPWTWWRKGGCRRCEPAHEAAIPDHQSPPAARAQPLDNSPTLCRMFNMAISSQGSPEYLSSDNDPLFLYHQWPAKPPITAQISALSVGNLIAADSIFCLSLPRSGLHHRQASSQGPPVATRRSRLAR